MGGWSVLEEALHKCKRLRARPHPALPLRCAQRRMRARTGMRMDLRRGFLTVFQTLRRWVALKRAARTEHRLLRRLAVEHSCSFRVRRNFVAARRDDQEIRISRPNEVYAHDLIRDFDYYFGVVEPRPEGKLRVVDYSRPALHTLTWGRLPFWFPELGEAMETTALYLEYAALQPGQTVLDLGAYAGGATYHFSRAVGPQGRVFAFEPDPR